MHQGVHGGGDQRSHRLGQGGGRIQGRDDNGDHRRIRGALLRLVKQQSSVIWRANRPGPGSQFFYDTAGSAEKTLKLYEGHFHDLLNDYGKEAVLADIQAWIDARLA